jgi:hypothetical protein
MWRASGAQREWVECMTQRKTLASEHRGNAIH